MDLTTLVAVCALTVDPKVMHALIWHQSGGEPCAFSVSGRREPQVLRNVGEALDAARGTRPDDAAIRVGLAGLPATTRSATAAMRPVRSRSLQNSAGRLAAPRATPSTAPSPLGAARGSGPTPASQLLSARRSPGTTRGLRDAVRIGNRDRRRLRLTTRTRDAEAVPSATSDDRERARLSRLFPATSTSGRSLGDNPATSRPAADEQTQGAPAIRLTVSQPHADGLFVARSAPRTTPRSE
jgi:hypothetical protein